MNLEALANDAIQFAELLAKACRDAELRSKAYEALQTLQMVKAMIRDGKE